MLPSITSEDWNAIQEVELATWTPHGWTDPQTGKAYLPYPSFEGKLEREQGYQRGMLSQFGITALNGIVLDIGCGPSPITEQVEGSFCGFGIDSLIPEYAKYHNVRGWKKVVPLTCPAEAIPLLDNTAHAIITTNAIDHFRAPQEALQEMVRLLAPGGMLYIQFCVKNASEGHPHPAHKIDMTGEQVKAYLNGKLTRIHDEMTVYGWRKQPAWMGTFAK